MQEVQVLVTLQIDLHDVTHEPTTPQIEKMRQSVMEAVRHAVKYAEGEGFIHPMADSASVGVADVELLPANIPFFLNELGSTYTEPKDRFVVSFIVGYDEPSVDTPQKAVGAAYSLTTDDGSLGTQWYCFDRKTQTMHIVEQSDADLNFE